MKSNQQFDKPDLAELTNGEYIPPAAMLLKQFGVTQIDLKKEQVLVPVQALLRLIRRAIHQTTFDEDWYLSRNPDVVAGLLSRDVPSAREHFFTTGYLEGRLPSCLAFDANWYFEHYKDIGSTFQREDVKGMLEHFLSTGYFEGRVGTAQAERQQSEWV